MWQGDFTFELSWRAGWWRSIVYGGTPEAEASFRGQLVIMRMKGRQTIFECCTQCMLYSVYAVLSVNSWSCHGEKERDDLTLCSAMMVEMWMRKRDGGWRWERCGGYERIWEIRGMTRLIELGRPRIGVITRQIGTHTCRIGDGKLTRTRNSLKSQFLMMICPISSTIT